MRSELLISGFGGQGILKAGMLLCHAAVKENKCVTFFPSYGAEMRGGTANCQVIISDESIGCPICYKPDILLSFNRQSYEKFNSKIIKNGKIIVNSNLHLPENVPDTLDVTTVAANEIAESCGSILTANMVMLGTTVSITKILQIDSLIDSIKDILPRKKDFWNINKKALEAGYKFLVDSR